MKKLLGILFLLIVVTCAAAFDTPTLTVMTYDSFAVSEDLVTEFEKTNNVKLQFLQAGNGGELISRAVLTKDAPVADVIIGFDNTQLAKAAEFGILEPYNSPMLANIPEAYQLDKTHAALPFNFGDVCINYDKAWFAEKGLALPASLDDLTKPEYRGLLAIENPVSSNPGMAFLLTTIADYGEDGYLAYWDKLLANDVVIANDWTSAYYTNFSGSSGMGPQPLVVSYTNSPAAEVIYAETELTDAPTGSLTSDGMCYRSIEFCGILKNAANQELAQKFIDAFLSKEWQEDLPMQMFVYPVNSEAELPEDFVLYGAPAENPVQIDNALVTSKRNEWAEAVSAMF